MCTPLQEPQTASKLTTMLLAMADVRAVLVALAARLARLRSAAALAGGGTTRVVCENLQKTYAVQGAAKPFQRATAVGNGPCGHALQGIAAPAALETCNNHGHTVAAVVYDVWGSSPHV